MTTTKHEANLKRSGKKLYSVAEAWRFVFDLARTMPAFKKGRGLISDSFFERIMLAVTEVNACAMCSYAHTRMALEAGLPEAEIKDMLSGDFKDAPEEEMPALLFAQDYAQWRGKASPEVWKQICARYGQERAGAILGVIRMIMVGNTFGIPFGSLQSRINGSKDTVDARSNLLYELSFVLCTPFVFVFGLLAGLIVLLFRMPLIA